MYLFFDTETTGKPKNYKAKMTDVDNWPNVTQLAFVVCDAAGEVVVKSSTLIKPKGWEIPKEQFFIDNNMSTERCEKDGIPIEMALDLFIQYSKDCEYLIAHNIAFDYNVLGAEMIRNSKTTGRKLKQVCTMESSTSYCELPGPFGFKWPKLEELHQILFNGSFQGAHDALNDVLITAKCFFELKKIGVIQL